MAYTPPTNPAGTAPTPTASAPNPYAWSIPIFEHYLGHPPSPADLASVGKLGLNYDMLVEHLRNQPSHVKGMTIGALEDYHKSASPAFFNWLGREATDQDIQELVNQGVRTPQDIEKYIRNRPDVVAAHPGAPVGLNDIEYSRHKAAIDSEYQQNVKRDATDEEARTAYRQQATPFRKAPAEQTALSSEVKIGAGGDLVSQAQIAPTLRQGTVPGQPSGMA